MAWFESIITSTMVAGLAIGGATWLLGRRFLDEFTRPGVTVEQGTPQWGGWTFPTSVMEPPEELQRAVTFQAADGALLRGEFWAQTHRAPTIVLSHGFHLPSRSFRSVAALEYAHGANILLFDYRGHGESASLPTTCARRSLLQRARKRRAVVRSISTGFRWELPSRCSYHPIPLSQGSLPIAPMRAWTT